MFFNFKNNIFKNSAVKECLNCGKNNHNTKECTLPITSYGIINFKLTGEFEKYNDMFQDKYIIKAFNPNINKINMYWFNKKNIHKLDNTEEGHECNTLINQLKESMLFILVSRKNSLGYIDYIKGKYTVELKSIQYLFEQMTDIEIFNIINQDFEYLWCDLWKKKKPTHKNEYEISLAKFNEVKEKYKDEINNFRPKYPIPEWGFPKGKKNSNETNMECAIRECNEETSLDISEFNLLNRLYPITEQLTGTNNIEYKHVYYLSIVNTYRQLNAITTDAFIEIDSVGWFKYDCIMNIIRPYHTEKKKIIDDIIKFIAYNILLLKKNKL